MQSQVMALTNDLGNPEYNLTELKYKSWYHLTTLYISVLFD